jgi:hypothetical protein
MINFKNNSADDDDDRSLRSGVFGNGDADSAADDMRLGCFLATLLVLCGVPLCQKH